MSEISSDNRDFTCIRIENAHTADPCSEYTIESLDRTHLSVRGCAFVNPSLYVISVSVLRLAVIVYISRRRVTVDLSNFTSMLNHPPTDKSFSCTSRQLLTVSCFFFPRFVELCLPQTQLRYQTSDQLNVYREACDRGQPTPQLLPMPSTTILIRSRKRSSATSSRFLRRSSSSGRW